MLFNNYYIGMTTYLVGKYSYVTVAVSRSKADYTLRWLEQLSSGGSSQIR